MSKFALSFILLSLIVASEAARRTWVESTYDLPLSNPISNIRVTENSRNVLDGTNFAEVES